MVVCIYLPDMELRKKAQKIIRELKKHYPTSQTVLTWSADWQLLVAVMLSAQTTDKKVNEVTPVLFKKYSSPNALARARVSDVERILRQVNYHKTKARNVIATGKRLVVEYNEKVPDTLAQLITLPGVGRKTANVVLGNLFDSTDGVAVDTHVRRLARLWGLSSKNDPKQIEHDLLLLIPQKERHLFTNRCIDYGREYCSARCKHLVCPLRGYIVES